MVPAFIVFIATSILLFHLPAQTSPENKIHKKRKRKNESYQTFLDQVFLQIAVNFSELPRHPWILLMWLVLALDREVLIDNKDHPHFLIRRNKNEIFKIQTKSH
jgi:hypothetical protein